MNTNFDIRKFDNYREGNRIEAKSAKRGLPRSLWETYSSFANSSGGVILLGFEEREDRSLVLSGIDDPDKVLDDFWNTVNNPQKVSENILADNDVRTFTDDGKTALAVFVPQANRRVKPIYLNDNPKRSFRRNNTGDYLCTMSEIRSMMRDAADESQDAAVLDKTPMEHLSFDTVRGYRNLFAALHEGHVWNGYDDEEFLASIGAAGTGADGALHPTVAGLVMFGEDRWITKALPEYFLDYRQELRPDERWQNRITSFSGDWSGNVYDYYHRVYNEMKQALKVPFKLEGVTRIDDTPAHEALREALVNCISNANYFERRGIVCQWTEDALVIANPGDFRMSFDEARRPGTSDPRNANLLKMFALIESGERAGSGMSKIFEGWTSVGYAEPSYETSFAPDRSVLTLPLVSTDLAGRNRQKSAEIGRNDARTTKDVIVDYLKENGLSKRSDLELVTGLKTSRINDILRELIAEGVVAAEGATRSRRYRLVK